MPWARLDDDFHDHLKVEGLSLAAIGLWTLNFTWAHRHRKTSPTPGFIPDARVRKLAVRQYDALTKELTTPVVGKKYGMWESVEGGFLIHNFARYLGKLRDPGEASTSGKKGAAKRWQGHSKQPSDEPPTEPSDSVADDGSRAAAPAYPTPTEPKGSSRPTPVPTTSGGDATADVGALVAEFVDRCRERPPSSFVARVGREVRTLALDGTTPDAIRGGLAIVADRGLQPTALAGAVHEHLNARPRIVRNQTADQLDAAMERAQAAEAGFTRKALP